METITLSKMADRIQENTGFYPSDIMMVLREFNKQLDAVIDNNDRYNLGCVIVWGEQVGDRYYQDPRDNSKKVFVAEHTQPKCRISDLTVKKYRYKRYIRDNKTNKVWDKYRPRDKKDWEV